MKIGAFLKKAGAKIIENKLGVTIGGAAAAVGTAGIFNPDLLELIPESLRGYAVLAVVGTLVFERVKTGLVEIINAVKYDHEEQNPK